GCWARRRRKVWGAPLRSRAPHRSITPTCHLTRPDSGGLRSSLFRNRLSKPKAFMNCAPQGTVSSGSKFTWFTRRVDQMPFEKIALEVSDGIATVTFRNPEKLNAWDGQMLDELKASVHTIARDDRVRAVILTGEGRAF